MLRRMDGFPLGHIRVAVVAAGITATCIALRGPLVRVCALALGAGIICFVTAPLAGVFEARLSRTLASVAGLLTVGTVLAGITWLLLPTIIRQLADLTGSIPEALGRLADWLCLARGWLEDRLPGIALPEPDLSAVQAAIAAVAGSTFGLAFDLAEMIGRVSMMAVLACFMLCDRERILLRMELLLPRSARHIAVSMGHAVCRELRLYLLGQLIIALAVAALAAGSLAILRIHDALVLGLLIGLLNMVPYFGPFIGGAPAVLIALGDSWQKALLTIAALSIVQQMDGYWISPRVMGSLTGVPPALVLLGVYAGAHIGGLGGMLFALPVMMTARTLFRVFVQKCENI